MLVQDWLREGSTLADLAAQYAIRLSRHRRHPNLVGLSYDQRNSPLDLPLVQECRGVVLDEADDWRCVARGFDKFFNYGEPLAPAIDWSTAVCQEKVDGTLCLLYWYGGEWQVATTGNPAASGPVGARTDLTFAKLFWRTAKRYRPALEPSPWTLLFELAANENRVVVRQEAATLTTLGGRHAETGAWRSAQEVAATVGIPAVREYPLRTIAEIQATFAAISPLEQEGYVVVDAAWRRVKLKHPGYVALHQLKEHATVKRCIEVIRRGEEAELISYFPELAAPVADLRRRYDALVAQIERDYARCAVHLDQKTFALAAVTTVCPDALFTLRRGRVAHIGEYLATIPIDRLLRLLDFSSADASRQLFQLA